MKMVHPLSIEVSQFLDDKTWIAQTHPFSLGDGIDTVRAPLIAASLAFEPHHSAFSEIARLSTALRRGEGGILQSKETHRVSTEARPISEDQAGDIMNISPFPYFLGQER